MLSASLPRRVGVSLLAAMTVAIAAGCGATSDSTADPAAVVPARAPVYLEATIAPEGQERDDALAAARKLLDTDDPEAEIRRLLSGHGDVEAWLGERAALFALGAGKGKGKGAGAVVAATSDADAAREWVQEQGSRTERHGDVELRLDEEGNAYALVEDRVVAGRPAAVRAAIDAAAGDALADAEDFEEALDRAGDEEGIGRAYLAPRALMDAGGGRSPGAGMFGALASGALTSSLPTAVGAHFHADGDALRADVASVGGQDPGAPADPAFLADLTGEAWLAAGLGEVGPRLREQIEALGASEAMLGLLSAQAGLDVEQDLLRWMGEGAIFVTGDGPGTLGGALVVQSTDPAASRAAVPKLAALVSRFVPGAATSPLRAAGVDAGVTVRMQGVPLPVQIAAAGDRFVVAVGEDALDEAISPSSTLGDDPDFQAAAATLGDDLQPTAYVAVRRIGALAARFGGADATDLQRTLERFTAFVAADRGEGRWSAALGLR